MKNDWQTWVILVGGLVAIVGQFWTGPGTTNLYLPVVGGVLAIIGGISK